MSTREEKIRAITKARVFLQGLLDPKITPKIPKKVRNEAYWVLRHYPADYEVKIKQCKLYVWRRN